MSINSKPHPDSRPFIDYFYKWEHEKADQVYLRQPLGDTYIDYTWQEVGRQARSMAAYLRSLNLPRQSPIGLVSKNCPHWLIADIAILISGHISVPFYPTLTADQLHSVLEHSQCTVLFVGKVDNWSSMQTGVPTNVLCIAFPENQPDAKLRPWDDILTTYTPMIDSPKPKLDDLFTIVYTSGTTGTPKGVMLDYRAAAQVAEWARAKTFQDLVGARFFSYLPLCHVAERNIVEAIGLITGGTIYFVESLATFSKNLAAARPTHFLAVPRIWTKFQQGILANMPQARLDRLLRIPIVSSLVKRKIRQRLGLNDTVMILTGAAPTPIPLIRWFRRLGICIQENYGMTENLGAVSMMPADQIKDGTVGRVNDGMNVRIDPDTGEILTQAAWNMRGYYRDPELTAKTLTADNWLHTGDLGELDSEGYLRITGRLNDLYKSAKGEFISPAKLEFGFSENQLVDQICVLGPQLPQPIALLVLSEIGQKTHPGEVATSLTDTLTAFNNQLQAYERIKKVILVKDTWSVDNNLMTPTLKIKRKEIEKRYLSTINAWYDQDDVVVWEA
ncbi:AMP-binding protein [Spirosoma sp. HMF3257]|uniref:AMP-dependent synthetase n=1 Tax=Spirosoma telluris TaxID=2183553 RepID=A0A327NK10_9BACT|nr:AMP-binding protein [Spirosoma telluris]RAI75537.1 AMP-dependent synthetase [Spirosoma telluris]